MVVPMIAEIKFVCSHCGQRIAVGSDSAGRSVDCPTCQNAVTIPDGAMQLEPRRKDGGLREKLAAAQSECERLRAEAKHAQAESKSFHNERLALRNEAVNLKQRATAAEAALASNARELSESRAALEQTQIVAAIVEARAIELETKRAGIAEQLAAAEARHAASLGEMASLRGLLDKDAASRQLIATKSNLAAAEEELRTGRQTVAQLEADLLTSETERKRLDEDRSAMQRRVAEALKQAEDSSKDCLNADNEKLRELLERQNEELKTRFRELTKFRRAKLALKIIWSLAALGIIGLGFLFAHILPAIEWGR